MLTLTDNLIFFCVNCPLAESVALILTYQVPDAADGLTTSWLPEMYTPAGKPIASYITWPVFPVLCKLYICPLESSLLPKTTENPKFPLNTAVASKKIKMNFFISFKNVIIKRP